MDAGLAVYVRSVTAGSVAAGEGELVKAGTSVTVGTATVQNANTVGDIEAGTSVSIYNAKEGSTGAVEAGTTVAIGTSALLNEGNVGSVTAGDSAGTTVTVYNGGAEIGNISAKSGSISIAANKGPNRRRGLETGQRGRGLERENAAKCGQRGGQRGQD